MDNTLALAPDLLLLSSPEQLFGAEQVWWTTVESLRAWTIGTDLFRETLGVFFRALDPVSVFLSACSIVWNDESSILGEALSSLHSTFEIFFLIFRARTLALASIVFSILKV